MRIKHILVQHQYEAEDLLRLLKRGQTFHDLAKKFSLCPSGKAGGSLGKVKPSQLDEDFLLATKALAPGEVSPPVRTRFGYHLIMIEPEVSH